MNDWVTQGTCHPGAKTGEVVPGPTSWLIPKVIGATFVQHRFFAGASHLGWVTRGLLSWSVHHYLLGLGKSPPLPWVGEQVSWCLRPCHLQGAGGERNCLLPVLGLAVSLPLCHAFKRPPNWDYLCQAKTQICNRHLANLPWTCPMVRLWGWAGVTRGEKGNANTQALGLDLSSPRWGQFLFSLSGLEDKP